jgi:hypothetical protein
MDFLLTIDCKISYLHTIRWKDEGKEGIGELAREEIVMKRYEVMASRGDWTHKKNRIG